jgi:nicotinate-nucleotide--dimethylbenzimidazole phosphoribosyltransferase
LEHAALAGMMCSAAAERVPVVLDGVITNAAALVAAALCPASVDYLIASHRTAEPGGPIALDHLKLPVLLDLGLRLGEGTGGLLVVPMVQAAARALGEMATLEELGLG